MLLTEDLMDCEGGGGVRTDPSAAEKYRISQTAYLEAALEDRFKRDHLLPSFD